MEPKILKEPIGIEELKKMAEEYFGDMVKAVVDVEQEIIALCAGLHADLEVRLVEECGSNRENTWGINIYPDKTGEEFIEFDSMVNIKPNLNNRSRYVEDEEIRKKIKNIVAKFLK